MMTFSKIGEFVSAEPFRPFRIRMASGRDFEVRHPEMILVGKSTVKVYTQPEADPDKPPHWHDVSMMLMETLEPIAAKTPAGHSEPNA